MLNVFYAEADIDKARFLFENAQGRTLVIVPEQFTLQMDRDALTYTKKEALTDIQVVSFSGLCHMVISKTGGKQNVISQEGRQMLLTKIVRENRGSLEIFGSNATNQEFISLLNDLISDMKQHETTPQLLSKVIENIEGDTLLKRKLSEVLTVFKSYEEYTNGKYMDNIDYLDFFISKIHEAEFIAKSDIWIYGFDSFAEKNMAIIRSLSESAKSVNIVLTYREEPASELTGALIARLKKEYNAPVTKIDDKYKFDRDVKYTLMRAANAYSEATTVAAYVLSLVRDKGYRYRDIALISNRLTDSAPLYKRVFAQHGINLFVDEKKDIMTHPTVTCIRMLLQIAIKYYRKDDVIRCLKTGLICESNDVDMLEIYAERYALDGKSWICELQKGKKKYGEEKLQKLNEIRELAISPIMGFVKTFNEAKTIGQMTEVLKNTLEKDICINEKLTELADCQEEAGNLEYAEETTQIWGKICEILEQLNTLIGDEEVSQKEFADILDMGLKSIKIGLIPPAADGLTMGNMRRSRQAIVKALVIVDAIDGILPAEGVNEGILNEDERELLSSKDIKICTLSREIAMEEEMAIYRNMGNAMEEIYISYAASDDEGREVNPSDVFTEIEENLGIKPKKDVFEEGSAGDLIGGKEARESNLLLAINATKDGTDLSEEWQEVFSWFVQKEEVQKLVDIIFAKIQVENISADDAELLYKKNGEAIVLSPTELEKFGECPFHHFMQYGMKAREERKYQVSPLDVGTVYHDCITTVSRKLSKNLKKNGLAVTDQASPWMTASEEDIRSLVRDTLGTISEEYEEGLLRGDEKQDYRVQRLGNVCEDAMWAIVSQVRAGTIKEMLFEQPFGKGKRVPPIEIKGALIDDVAGANATVVNATGANVAGADKAEANKAGANKEERNIFIEGRIDRLDILDGDYSKVIDYKTGKNQYDEKYAKSGMKLQLFIYLFASMGLGLKPGGAFYMQLHDATLKARDIKIKNGGADGDDAQAFNMALAEKREMSYKVDGFFVDDKQFLDVSDPGCKGFEGNTSRANKHKLSKEQFDDLLLGMSGVIEDMSKKIADGIIEIKPKKDRKPGGKNACTYCPYNGICKFDSSIEECRYIMI